MRISVCEFLRITTKKNWYYLDKGHWVSDGWEYQAIRDDVKEDHLNVFPTKNPVEVNTLVYFRGESSHNIRAKTKNQKIKDRYRKAKNNGK